jgi:hypothetical protein
VRARLTLTGVSVLDLHRPQCWYWYPIEGSTKDQRLPNTGLRSF